MVMTDNKKMAWILWEWTKTLVGSNREWEQLWFEQNRQNMLLFIQKEKYNLLCFNLEKKVRTTCLNKNAETKSSIKPLEEKEKKIWQRRTDKITGKEGYRE